MKDTIYFLHHTSDQFMLLVFFFSQQFASLNVKMADHAYFPTSASAMRDFMAATANNVSRPKRCQQFQDLV